MLSHDAAHDRHPPSRRLRRRARRTTLDAGLHVAGWQEARVLHVDDRHLRRRTPPPRRSIAGQVGLAPRAQRLAEQPGAHHVAEEPDRAVDAALVGEAGEPRLLGQHRGVRARGRRAPRCRGRRTPRRRSAWARRRPPRRCRATPTDTTGTSPADAVGDVGQQRLPQVAGVDQGGEERHVEAEPHHQLGVPLAGRDVEQAGRRGVGALGDVVAGQRGGHQVGDQQDLGRLAEPVVGGELVDRVEGQVLQAVAAVELLGADQLGHGRDRPRCGARRGSGTAARGAGRGAAARSRPPRSRRRSRRAARRRTPSRDRRSRGRPAPATSQCRPSSVAHGVVGEAGRGRQPQRVRSHLADHHPAAGGAQVDGREAARLIAGTLPRRRSRRGCGGRWCGRARGSRARRRPGRSARGAPPA